MKVNKIKGEGHHYLDDNSIILSNSTSEGIGDSLGRTAIGALVYDEDRNYLIKGIISNFRYIRTSPEAGDQQYVSRYPKGERWAAVGSSRDHVLYAVSALKQLGEDSIVKSFVKTRAKRPCIDHSYTLGQKVWFKALYSNFMSWVYAMTITPLTLLNMGLNRLSRPLIKKEVYPTYAAFYTLFAIQAIQSKSAKRYLKKLFRGHFEKSNYVAQMLCGVNVSEDDVNDYVPTRKNRWTTRLDGTSNRDLSQYNDTVENNLELGYLHYLYEQQKAKV